MYHDYQILNARGSLVNIYHRKSKNSKWLHIQQHQRTPGYFDLNDKLQKLMEEFKSKLPQRDGLLLRPQARKWLKLSLQKKVSKGTKPLPPPPKKREKEAVI